MYQTSFSRFGQSLTSNVPKDVIALVSVVFATFSLGHLQPALMRPLWLTRDVWTGLQLWKLVTYPFMGWGVPNLWILLELLILFMFAKDAFWNLGRKLFWQMTIGVSAAAAVVAVLADIAVGAPVPFVIMLGQRMLMVLYITTFAVIHRRASILFMFLVPIQARWFLVMEGLFSFLAFLQTRDFPGFIGLMAALAITWSWLQPGGIRVQLRRLRLKLEERWIRYKIDRERDRKIQEFELPNSDGRDRDRDRWVN